ncbi:MAG TPA: glycosyltransferase [Pirellulales bacterium]|nr:glycosyltransferase [Pirellulales bacterium]
MESTSRPPPIPQEPIAQQDIEQPLRVALCITELEIGGAERCLVELATRIDRRRILPIVYALSPPPEPDQRSLLPQLQAAGVETHFLGATRAQHLPAAVGRLTRLLKRQRPDLLQSFLFHASFVGRWAAWRAGVPRVLSGVRVAEQGVWWHVWLDRITSRLVDRYVCVSGAVAEFARSRLGLPEDRFVVVPNGVDVERFAAAPATDLADLGLSAGRRAVTYIGRLETQKGVAELIETGPQWLEKSPGHDLVMVGAGPMERQLRGLAEQLGVASRVHFAGWRSDVAEILKASDLLVLPSRWEGMPNVILEAMAAGRAVASTDVEGVRELLGEAATEQIVPRGDYGTLAARIAALVGDEGVRERLGAANRRRAEQFSWDKMVHAYEKLFWDVTHAARAGVAR